MEMQAARQQGIQREREKEREREREREREKERERAITAREDDEKMRAMQQFFG